MWRYPQNANQPRASCAATFSTPPAMARSSSSVQRALAARRSALILDHIFLMGFQSGEYAGRSCSWHPAASIPSAAVGPDRRQAAIIGVVSQCPPDAAACRRAPSRPRPRRRIRYSLRNKLNRSIYAWLAAFSSSAAGRQASRGCPQWTGWTVRKMRDALSAKAPLLLHRRQHLHQTRIKKLATDGLVYVRREKIRAGFKGF